MEEKGTDRKHSIPEQAEQIAVRDTVGNFRLLVPFMLLLLVALTIWWLLDICGDRSTRWGTLYFVCYVFLCLGVCVSVWIIKNCPADSPENVHRLNLLQLSFAWILPFAAVTMTLLDAINRSRAFGVQVFVIAEILVMCISCMKPGKWVLIQIASGIGMVISVCIMPMEDRFTFVAELMSFLVTSAAAGRILFRMKMNAYVQQAELKTLLDSVEYDSLTGVFTREAFFRKAEEALGKGMNARYRMLATDIDNFKQINSIYGTQKGDEVLRYLAEQYRRFSVLTGRYGADQFICLCMVTEKMTDREIENTLCGISENAPVKNLAVKYGFYDIREKGEPVSQMCDRALFAAKTIRHNFARQIAYYDGPVGRQHLQSQLYEADFEEALNNREFIAWFQPQYSSDFGKAVSAEALIRWRDSSGNLIPPGNFIPVFENDGLITRLDLYVFEEVCRAQSSRIKEGKRAIAVSVNISRATLHEENLADKLKQILKRYEVPITLIPLEVTESQDVPLQEFRELVESLKNAGFEIHMDDFGSGFATLNTINTFSFSAMKLDKTLVDDVSTKGGEELLRHIIEFSHFRNMLVIAEGVEKKEQMEILRGLHCDLIQGYYFGRPMPYEAFDSLISKEA